MTKAFVMTTTSGDRVETVIAVTGDDMTSEDVVEVQTRGVQEMMDNNPQKPISPPVVTVTVEPLGQTG